MKRGLFAAGIGVDVAADGLDLGSDILGRPRGRALERHVFEHVRESRLGRVLVPRAAVHPHTQGRAHEMRHGIGCHDQTGRKPCDLNGHVFLMRSRMNSSTAALAFASTV